MDKLYEEHNWEGFAKAFLAEYAVTTDQLSMIRDLQLKYRRAEILELITPYL